MRLNKALLLGLLATPLAASAGNATRFDQFIGDWSCHAETEIKATGSMDEGHVNVSQDYNTTLKADGGSSDVSTTLVTLRMMGTPVSVVIKSRGESSARLQGNTLHIVPLAFTLESSALKEPVTIDIVAAASVGADGKKRRLKNEERKKLEAQQQVVNEYVANLAEVSAKSTDRDARRRIKNKTETTLLIEDVTQDAWRGRVEQNGTTTAIQCQRAH